MGYLLELNFLLRIPPDEGLDLTTLEVGRQYEITKKGERLYPLNIAIEICDGDYNYVGKVAVRTLTLGSGKTQLTFEVLKIFDEHEREVFTRNFIKAKDV